MPFTLLLLVPLALLQDGSSGPDDRRVIHGSPAPSSDTIGLTTQQTGYTLEHAVVEASTRTALIFYDHKGPHRGTVLRDVLIHVAPGTLPLDRSYWAIRGYDMVDTLLEDVEITGFGRVTERHDEGHAAYLNLAGDLTVRDCYVHHNGGQALQLVNRPNESSLARGPAKGTIAIERSRFHENGFNPDRGAFQVSIFGTGQDVTMRDVEILAGLDDTEWPGGLTGGGIVIEPEPWAPNRNKDPWWRPADAEGEVEPPFTQGRVVLENVVLRFRDPSKSLAQIKGCRELVVRGCTFEVLGEHEGKVVLDAPDKPGRSSGRIVWEGNRGNAVVLLRGERVGGVGEDFVIEDEGSPGTGGSR